MTIQVNNPPNPSGLTPASQPPVQSQADILAACQAMILKSIIDSSQATLNQANQSLENQVQLGQRKFGLGHDKLLQTNVTPSEAKGSPADPTQTNYIVAAYSLICQIDEAEQSLKQGRITLSEYDNLIGRTTPGNVGLYSELFAAIKNVTDPTANALIQKVIDYINNSDPNKPTWQDFMTNDGIQLQIAQYIGGTDQTLNIDLSSPDDQMNLMQILCDLIQNPASTEVKDKTLDALFFGQGVDIYQTIAAYYMEKEGGDWSKAQADLKNIIQLLPTASTASPSTTPKYDQFIAGLTAASTSASWPYTATPDVILNDGFGFNSAWVVFRTGGPITNPNYILFGSG